MIGIFNRSYYEDVLVPRVHPDALARQHLPAGLAEASGFWEGRLDDIAAAHEHVDHGPRDGRVLLSIPY